MKYLIIVLLISLSHCSSTSSSQQFADNETAAFNNDMANEDAYEYKIIAMLDQIKDPRERFSVYQREYEASQKRRLSIADRHSARLDQYIARETTYNNAQVQSLQQVGLAVINKKTLPTTNTIIIKQNNLPSY